LRVRPGAYPRVEHLKGASLGLSLALPANIRLGWKGLPGPNTSLLRKSVNCGCKKFYSTGPRMLTWVQILEPMMTITFGSSFALYK